MRNRLIIEVGSFEMLVKHREMDQCIADEFVIVPRHNGTASSRT